MKLVLFDFDGTITRKDTLFEFFRFTHGKDRYISGIILHFHILFLAWLRLYPRAIAKKKLLKHFYKGWTKEDLFDAGKLYFHKVIHYITYEEAMKELKAYLDDDARIIVVSASLDVWVKPFCDYYDIEFIGTQLQYNAGIYEGSFATPNCNGKEKVKRIKEAVDITDYEPVIAYGNSSGDKPMLSLADETHYKAFKK
ncbi:MAG: HAD-IB family hydrolase [Bacteroidota bacterium]|mgnify:CR=1 FL=1